DWTQADLAEKVGISRQAVTSIEKTINNSVIRIGI
ncbi:MAG: helix-turn-helix transcriptional regulator, partial [Lachnospiraceae bacterium]